MDDLESLFMLLAGASDKQLARIDQAVSDYRDARAPHDFTEDLEDVELRARSMVDAFALDMRKVDRKLGAFLFSSPMESVEDYRAVLRAVEAVPGHDAACVFSKVLSAYAFRLAQEHVKIKDLLTPSADRVAEVSS